MSKTVENENTFTENNTVEKLVIAERERITLPESVNIEASIAKLIETAKIAMLDAQGDLTKQDARWSNTPWFLENLGIFEQKILAKVVEIVLNQGLFLDTTKTILNYCSSELVSKAWKNVYIEGAIENPKNPLFNLTPKTIKELEDLTIEQKNTILEEDYPLLSKMLPAQICQNYRDKYDILIGACADIVEDVLKLEIPDIVLAEIKNDDPSGGIINVVIQVLKEGYLNEEVNECVSPASALPKENFLLSQTQTITNDFSDENDVAKQNIQEIQVAGESKTEDSSS